MLPLTIKTTTGISYDRSTQVNFPLPKSQVPKRNLRNFKRYPTSEDIYNTQTRTQMYATTNWQNSNKQNTLPRPKSLNFSTDQQFLRTTLKSYSNSDSPISRTSSQEVNLSPLTAPSSYYGGRDKKSSSPSNILKNGFKSISTQKLIHNIDEESTGACSCKCSCKNSIEFNKPTPMLNISERQSLSWRKLHMSRAKLKATSATSELLSGFAMVAMVELQINEPTGVPEWLFVLFAVCTTILVSVHIFALMISTYILPNIDAIAKMDICEWVSESPHERMRGFIEIAWAFSTVLGLFLFLIEVAILCWVKFWDYSFPAAIAATVIVIPVLIIFVLFAVHFYHSLVVIKCNSSYNDMVKLEDMKKQLDMVSPV